MRKILVSLVLVFSIFFTSYASNSSWVSELNKLTGKNLSEQGYSNLDTIYLDNKNLKEIPEGVFKLQGKGIRTFSGIKSIYLSGNDITDFSGLVSGNLFEGVDGYLEELYLNDNKISNLFDGLGNLNALKVLYLAKNNISKIDEISNLTNLEELNLNLNHISNLPNDFSKLQKLEKLYLNRNKFNKLPGGISLLYKLKDLDLSGNNIKYLSEGLPDAMVIQSGFPSSLEELNLSNNNMIKIAANFRVIGMLKRLDLRGNSNLGKLNTVFDVKNDKIRKCQNNITTSGKRMCIDSNGDRIRVTVEENIVEMIELTGTIKKQIDKLLNNYYKKFSNKTIANQIKITEKIGRVIGKAIESGKYTRLRNVLFYMQINIDNHIKDLKVKTGKYNLDNTFSYGKKTIKVYKKYTGRQYKTTYGKNNPHETVKYTILDNNIKGGDKYSYSMETKIKVTYSVYGNPEKTIFEKAGPEYGDCIQDACENNIYGVGVFNNKLLFESSVNIENGRYEMFKNFIYDFNKNKLIEKDFGGNIKSGLKGIYFIRNNSDLGYYKNIKLILLDNNYNEKVLYEDSNGNINFDTGYSPAGTETLTNYELLSNGRIKLFLRGTNSKGKEYVFSKIINVK